MPAGLPGSGCGEVRNGVEVGGGAARRSAPVPGEAPGPGWLRGARSAAALPRPQQPRTLAARTSTKASRAPTPSTSVLPVTPAGVFLRVPHTEPDRTNTQAVALFPSQCQNFPEQVQPAPALTLSRQLTFSVGYTTFPQRAH